MRAKSAQPVPGRMGLAAQATASPEHPAQTGSVAIPPIAQPGQGDLGVRSELVGMHEVVQALLGLPILGLLTRTLLRPSVRDWRAGNRSRRPQHSLAPTGAPRIRNGHRAAGEPPRLGPGPIDEYYPGSCEPAEHKGTPGGHTGGSSCLAARPSHFGFAVRQGKLMGDYTASLG